ncbi:hypothetical protein, partial [uncultured Brevundimonas sp.]|uniref:hypothetical protein n=1 Tax=uncultured Brevundimonas sp. TaxID=213418 RepID=UPI00262EA88B
MKNAKPLALTSTALCGWLALASLASAQSGNSTAQSLTRELNSRLPSQTQTAPAPAPAPAPRGTTSAPAVAAPAAATQAPRASAPSAPAPTAAAAPATGSAAAAPEAVEDAPPPPVRPVQLSPQAIAALPFSLDLKGTRVTERSGPSGTKIYTVAKGEVPLLMIYTGPQADYPIYAGEEAVVAGRTSILVSDGGSRKAVEHLFRRD